MKLQVSGIIPDSIVDGPGLRMTVFTQGCPHHCPGCHNVDTHPFSGGKFIDTAEITAQIDKNPLLDGITLSGGEPFAQALACLEIAQAAKARGLHVITYTGYTFEELVGNNEPAANLLISNSDWLIDGPFFLEQKTYSLPWRGSFNQRILNGQESIIRKQAIPIIG